MNPASASPCRASTLLADSVLGTVLSRIERHRAILRRIQGWLPGTLAEHCKDCVEGSQQRLILFTDGPAWAFQLRFHAPTLLAKLSEVQDLRFRSIEIRNLPAAEPSRRKHHKPAPCPESARLIGDCAKTSSSTELAAAFARLAATLATNSKGASGA